MHVGLAGSSPEDIIHSMDLKGIEKSWLLTWQEIKPPIPALHMDLPPEQVLEAYKKFPDRFVPFFAPDPNSANIETLFTHFLDLGVKGCAELKVSLNWDDPLLEPYLKIVERHSLALIFHMENPRLHYMQEKDGLFEWILERLLNDKFNGVSRYYISRFAKATGFLKNKISRNQIPFPGILYDFLALEARVRQFPGIKFIGHGPDFWNNISCNRHSKYIHQKGSISEFGIIDQFLEEHDNFFCDISGTSGYNAMRRDPRQAKIFLQKHAQKVLYGTDNTRFPLLDLLYSMHLGKEKMEMILYKNALKVLA